MIALAKAPATPSSGETPARSPAQSAGPHHAPDAPPARGWTPEVRVRFLDRLALHGNARAACRTVGLSAESAYRLRRRDSAFARAWDAALLLGRDNSEAVLSERAIEGVEEQIYYRGELVGTRRRYDSRLLLAHLARLDALTKDTQSAAGEWAGRFDVVLAGIAAGESESDIALDRLGYACARADRASRSHREAELDAFHGEEGDDDALIESGVSATEVHNTEVAFLDELEDECCEVYETTHRAAAAQWDSNLENLRTLLDGEDTDTPPRGPAPPPRHVLAMIRSAVAACEPDNRLAAKSFPRTASTVSTSALARSLAACGPAPGIRREEPPTSPKNRRRRARRR